MSMPTLTSGRELRHREGSSLQGEAWGQDLEHAPLSATAGPLPARVQCVRRPSGPRQSARCTPSPPSWGVEMEGPRHCPHLEPPFPPLAQSQQGLTKPQSQIRAQSEPVLLGCRPWGWAAGGGRQGEAGGGRGRLLAAPGPCYQQPCPPPSPLAPLKFTHLIGCRLAEGQLKCLCQAAEGCLPPGPASARDHVGGPG